MDYWFEIKKTQLEMVRDRGYNIEDEAGILDMTLDEFINNYNNSKIINKISDINEEEYKSIFFLSKSYKKIVDGHTKILSVAYKTLAGKKKICIEQIINFISQCKIPKNHNKAKEEYCDDSILIITHDISSGGKRKLGDLTSVNISIFKDRELLYNPTTHIDCPKFILLNDDEKIELMKSLRCKLSDFLIIKQADPIIRYYGWKSGQIVKIIRDDEFYNVISPVSINYRVIL